MSQFVEECRREWKRLGVPDPVANEMAADLAADLKAVRDDVMKLTRLPVWQGEEVLAKMKPRKKEDEGLFGFLVPALSRSLTGAGPEQPWRFSSSPGQQPRRPAAPGRPLFSWPVF